MIKKIVDFLGLTAYAVGALGGCGYALYCKAYVIAAAVVVLAVMAFPTAKKLFNDLIDKSDERDKK